jgi:tRNA pseudouridine38-40 synthase
VPRIALLLEYLGTKFHGSQYQDNVRTVQLELEKALTALVGSSSRIVLSGRTDSGVHSHGQVAHFDWSVDDPFLARFAATDSNLAPSIDLWRFVWALNGILPGDLSIIAAQNVPDDFHARYSASERQYAYRILNRPQRSALLQETYHFLPFPLNLKAMSEASSLLIGKHDFVSFKSSNGDQGSTFCDVFQAEILNLGEGRLEFWMTANHFVYNMVRIIVGTLLEIGLGKKTPVDLKQALANCDRNLAGPTAPANGLTLISVKYPEQFNLFVDQRSHSS